MSVSTFTDGSLVSASQLNAIVNQVNTNTNNFTDSGWVSDMTAATGFTITSATMRVDTGVMYASGTIQITTAPTAGVSVGVQFLSWGSTSSSLMSSVHGGNCGFFMSNTGVSGIVTVNSSGLSMGYRTANPAASTYIVFTATWNAS